MNNFLSFLDNAKIEEVIKVTKPGSGKAKEWNPTVDFMGLRIWKNGSVFPSQILCDTYDLEYKEATIILDSNGAKEVTYPKGQGNGLDIIDSAAWEKLSGVNQRFIAIAFTPKNAPKIDLFGQTRYDEKGKPVASVMEQGSATFGETKFLPLLKDIYNIEPNEEGFIDLRILTERNLNTLSASNLFFLPKTISRGVDAGKPDYVRRENIDIFVLVPESVYTAQNSIQESPIHEPVHVIA